MNIATQPAPADVQLRWQVKINRFDQALDQAYNYTFREHMFFDDYLAVGNIQYGRGVPEVDRHIWGILVNIIENAMEDYQDTPMWN